MPRAYQAYPQNAVVTHSPSNAGSADPAAALKQAQTTFKIPSMLDACANINSGTKNPFISGLNTMGEGNNTSGAAGQTGNVLSGFQMFTDSLCGYALGGTSVGEVLEAARQLRREGGDVRETLDAVRRLRGTVGAGTTPQSVLAGVGAVTGFVNANPAAQGAIAQGQAAAGVSGNQIIDAANGAQVMANQGGTLLTGTSGSDVTGSDLLTAGGQAIAHNTAQHAGHVSQTTAQSVTVSNQNLLVCEDFSSGYTVVDDPDGRWSWDGTDGAPTTNVLGCLAVTCTGAQTDYLSSETPVTVGENIEISCEYKTESLVFSGNPITLAVEKFRQMRSASGQTTYADIGSYAVTSVSDVGLNPDTDWTGIAGTYTVQPGVDQIRVRFQVNSAAAGGTVKFDSAALLKLDLISGEAVPATGATTDAIVTNLYGTAGSGFSNNQAAVALANTKSSLTSVTSAVAQLQAEGSAGAIAGDDFGWTGDLHTNANWNASWTEGSSSPGSYYHADGADAQWTAPDVLPQTIQYQWVGTDSVSTTDYQVVQVVLDSAPVSYTPYGGGTLKSWIYLDGRMGVTGYVIAGISSEGDYVVGYETSGGFDTMDSGTISSVPGAGTAIALYCGDKSTTSPRHFRLMVGSTVVSEFDEVGTGSPLGSGNRGWGFGAFADGQGGWLYPGQAVPPLVDQWLAMDQ